MEEVAYFASAMKSQREALQMRVQFGTEVVHQPLAQVNGEVIADDITHPNQRIDQHQYQAAHEEQGLGCQSQWPTPGHRMVCEDMIDNELERPGLEQLQSPYQQHLGHR